MNSIDLKKNEISSLPISRVGLYCIVFEKKDQNFSLPIRRVALYCIVFLKIEVYRIYF